MDFCCPFCTVKLIVTTGYLFSRFHANLATKNWSLSYPDAKLIRIRILQIISDPTGSGSTTLPIQQCFLNLQLILSCSLAGLPSEAPARSAVLPCALPDLQPVRARLAPARLRPLRHDDARVPLTGGQSSPTRGERHGVWRLVSGPCVKEDS